MKDFMVFMRKLLIPWKKSYEKSCRIHSMGFIASSRLVVKQLSNPQIEKDAGIIVSL